jgi:hypothetical protein
LVLRLRGGGCPTYYADPHEFDPHWNFDFRRIEKDTGKFFRGLSPYTRPLGSMRYAIKAYLFVYFTFIHHNKIDWTQVLDKYNDRDGNAWLGSSNADS